MERPPREGRGPAFGEAVKKILRRKKRPENGSEAANPTRGRGFRARSWGVPGNSNAANNNNTADQGAPPVTSPIVFRRNRFPSIRPGMKWPTSEQDTVSTTSSLTNCDDLAFEPSSALVKSNDASLCVKPLLGQMDTNLTSSTSAEITRPTLTSNELTVYQPPKSFPDAVGAWLLAADDLLGSSEMAHFLCQSRDLALHASGLAVKTAFLPVTLPLYVACSTTEMVVGTSALVLSTTGSLLHSVVAGSEKERNDDEDQSNPVLDLIQGVFGLPGFMVGVAGKIKDDIGGAVMHAVAPVLGMGDDSTSKCGSSSGDSDRLHRLRLDFSDGEPALNASQAIVENKPLPKTSMFLLRVGDLGLMTHEENARIITFIDLKPDGRDLQLVSKALNRFVSRGLSMLANHPTVRLAKPDNALPDFQIEWKAEGGSGKLLRRMAKMTSLERLKALQSETIIWSGKFKDEDGYRRNSPFFLARGVVHMSPREFLCLLWDNSRTSEYNNFCLGRSTVLSLEDKVLEGASVGTKVIKSETRIPLTKMSVQGHCIMHVRPLESPDAGFVILSRSVDSGIAGTHYGDKGLESSAKNEILWGINVLRCVPGHPHLTDLTSLSQVGSSLVPKFLTQRIGIMGIEDFFKNVRRLGSEKSSRDSKDDGRDAQLHKEGEMKPRAQERQLEITTSQTEVATTPRHSKENSEPVPGSVFNGDAEVLSPTPELQKLEITPPKSSDKPQENPATTLLEAEVRRKEKLRALSPLPKAQHATAVVTPTAQEKEVIGTVSVEHAVKQVNASDRVELESPTTSLAIVEAA